MLTFLFVLPISSAEDREDGLNVNGGVPGRSLILQCRLLQLAGSILPNVGSKHLHDRPMEFCGLIRNAFERVNSSQTDLQLFLSVLINCAKLLNGFGKPVGNLTFSR